ncbi:GbsR/MarR family transcriptional regulator [Methanogenium sp. MK-MG]|uniref:GbsR/MarR family transcriptional regulator n=1 Tax=Methanogenium sp. MK-MG TaxID=2599926 RepID=UPI0013EA6775|nr:hypothetical protein [Methanogenium sp. MK-MG]KAF1075262.1 hypothetical protein MKMG_01755 [Methanogenium sp. MK-MG]
MDDCDHAFVSYYQKIGRAYGMDDLSVKIFALLFVSPTEISLEDLAKETRYSLSSVSNKAKMLEMNNWITRVRKAGSKKVFYYTEKDMMTSILRIMERVGSVEATAAKAEIPTIISHLKSHDMSDEEKEKIEILRIYLHDMQTLDKIIQEWRDMIARMRDK